MPFSREDRNLLLRVGKTMQEQLAASNAAINATIPGSITFKVAMAKRNRLLRDNTDLIALRKRIERAVKEESAKTPPLSD